MTLAAAPTRLSLAALLCALSACHGGSDIVPPPQKTERDVHRLVIAPDTSLLYVGQTFQLVTQAFDPEGKLVPGVSARFSVVEGTSVSVTETGTLTAVRPGRTVISAKVTNAEGRSRIGVVVPGT